ncbi:hypothetical protein SAMN05444008_12521 [Cnuella takakiae]|uniref:Uncharacterized protein n=1 Tax=Cnuella takakiae TaxID=1302690 RepID=A0A1M5IR15_9BACT|nr:hypothetical protein [Cnuella takakiae]OLY93959.1 hypothetical protein BUE76_20290 [Cnuella takakiae]SHG30701.1 hypothetical protein SAMN05444008_12521 [Cnuella takakiae]
MKKKFVLLATAGMLATASLVYASLPGENKAAVKSNSETKKEVKKSKCSGSARKSMCSGYYTRTT